MAERQPTSAVSATGRSEGGFPVLALLAGALVWGVIWYPYRFLRDAGVDGVTASVATYAVAFVLGALLFRRSLAEIRFSWSLLWLALASAGCNLGYVLATLSGEVVRVLLLFYLAPLWTVLLSRVLIGERLGAYGGSVIALSLAGAATILWQPRIGFPLPQSVADWLGLGAGFSFALFNVLSRYAKNHPIEVRSMVAFSGVVIGGAFLMVLEGAAWPPFGAFSLWALLLLLGIVLLVVNWVVQYGLARVVSNRAIIIMLSEVGFAALSSWALANEMMGLREWIGGAMIIAASIFSSKMET